MPWVEEMTKPGGLKGRESFPSHASSSRISRPYRPQRYGVPFSQGIGLRPQMLCRVEGSQWRAEGL